MLNPLVGPLECTATVTSDSGILLLILEERVENKGELVQLRQAHADFEKHAEVKKQEHRSCLLDKVVFNVYASRQI